MKKEEYRNFLSTYFNGLKLRTPLFYSWDVGIRFNLQTDTNNDEIYFLEVIKRASVLYEAIFDLTDSVYIVFMDYKYKRNKIRLSNYVFKQIKNFSKENVCFKKEGKYYFGTANVGIVKTNASEFNYINILTAITNSDFQNRQPRLDKRFFSSKEVYFINIDKKIIFNMYDDRGIDIIASDKDHLKLIYTKYNDWILDYDRKRIDEVFK